MSRQKECEQLTDVINKYYIGKVVEIQNVFLEERVRVPYIGAYFLYKMLLDTTFEEGH